MMGKSFFSLLLVIEMMSACSMGKVYINALQPAEISLPDSLQRISIFPAAGIPEMPGEWDSISEIKLSPFVDYNTIKMGYIYGLYDVLSTSPRFQKVVIADSTWKGYARPGYLSWDELLQICRHDSTDAVLILKKAVSYDKLEHRIFEDSPCFFIYSMINQTKWAFYFPSTRTATENLVFTDTTSFEQNDENCSVMSKLQNVSTALYESCFFSGMQVATKISPYWKENIIRNYYSGQNKEMREAASFVKRDHWQAAAEIWNSHVENENNRLASKAAYNLALAWERDDLLDQAWLWINYADSLHRNRKILIYKDLLDKRMKSRLILDRQMAGN